jgi:hypothetical protein
MIDGQPPDDLAADAIFGAASAPNVAAVKAARQVICGETPDDELSDTDAALVAASPWTTPIASSSTIA